MKLLILSTILFSLSAISAPIFDDNSVIEINLSYDIAKLQADKENLREEGLEGTLIELSTNLELPVQVLTRGKGSFDCLQPQLKLKFDKKLTKETIFKKLKKVKLFTKGTCLENKTDSEQDRQIIANYLIYKLYEEMTDYSFKTRLLKINYTDISGTYSDYTQYVFFLEPKKNLEKRLKLKNVSHIELLQMADKVVPLLDNETVKLVNAFELMITNYDYGISGLFSHIINDSGYEGAYYGEKNSKIYQNENGKMIPFIYDFDFSRFGYTAPVCMFGYAFFHSNFVYNPECSVENLADTLNRDLKMFKYKDDFYSNLKTLVVGLTAWSDKHKALIDMLGPEYNHGLNNFKATLQLKLDSLSVLENQ